MKLPYRAVTKTGDTFDIEFPLHGETDSAVRVEQLVSSLLDAIDKDIELGGEGSNGDILQAIAITMAIRSGIIHAPHETTGKLARQLVDTALEAMASSTRRQPLCGHA